MALQRSTVVLVGFGLIVSACSTNGGGSSVQGDESSEATSVSEAETEASTTTATFRDEPPRDGRLTQEFVDASLLEQIDDFLDAPNSGKSAVIAANMGASGESRWIPWLLDIHRLAQSTKSDKEAINALALLTGIEPVGVRVDDFRIYGQLAQSEGIDAGEGYREWKLGLYGFIDDEFAELLSGIADDQLLSEIHWGGVTRGGIPELNNPERVPVSEADWMTPDELVLGAEVNGEAVAYPVRILGHHELANDVIADIPVSMVYCTLCRTGLLFDRRLGDEVLDFQTSGLLWSSNKVMVDKPSDTLWQHLTGTGIAGPNEGVVLEQFPVVTSSWSDWVEEHPDSETLVIPGPIFFPETPERPPIVYPYDPGGAYQNYYENPDVWFPIFDTPDVFALKTDVLGLDVNGDTLAIEVAALVDHGPRVFVVGEQAVLFVPTTNGARAYDAQGAGVVDGDVPDIADADPERVVLADGTELERIVVAQTFWFAWFGDHQDTRTWPES